MRRLTLVVTSALVVVSAARTRADSPPEPPPTAEEILGEAAVPNVIVPHDTEPEASKPKEKVPSELVEKTSDDVIELVDVTSVVEIPKSARGGMFAADKMLPDSQVRSVGENGNLERQVTGVMSSYYIADDNHVIMHGISETVRAAGKSGTRPVLMVTLKTKDDVCDHQRYPLGVKSVKDGVAGVEPGKELRGSVKAVGAGTKPKSYDVYIEVTVPDGETEKSVLLRGSFDESSLPCLQEKKEPS